MTENAYRTLRIILAAAIVLLLFGQIGYPARQRAGRAKKYTHRPSQSRKATPTKTSAQPVERARSTTFGVPIMDDVEVRSDDYAVSTVGTKDKLEILEREGDYFKVRLSDGTVGTVIADLLKVEETRKPLPVSDTWGFRSDIVRTAASYRGSRYRRGGISSRGFDCSGFVMHVYSRYGVRLPHSSRAQFRCGRSVSRADLLPGDLVFFSGTYRRGISHVGMYVGGGKFIHASTSRGGVRTDALDSAYFRRKYAGARRVKILTEPAAYFAAGLRSFPPGKYPFVHVQQLRHLLLPGVLPNHKIPASSAELGRLLWRRRHPSASRPEAPRGFPGALGDRSLLPPE